MKHKWNIAGRTLKNIIVLLIIAGFVIWRIFDKSTTAQIILSGVKNDKFQGIVDSVYRDKSDHNAKKVRLTSGYLYSLYPEWESKVAIGDSLSKKQNSVVVEVFKSNGNKIILDYKELVKTIRN